MAKTNFPPLCAVTGIGIGIGIRLGIGIIVCLALAAAGWIVIFACAAVTEINHQKECMNADRRYSYRRADIRTESHTDVHMEINSRNQITTYVTFNNCNFFIGSGNTNIAFAVPEQSGTARLTGETGYAQIPVPQSRPAAIPEQKGERAYDYLCP